jgi:hypothetical protein
MPAQPGAALNDLFISGKLANDLLTYALLASLHSISVSDSSLRNLVGFCDASVDFCASRFMQYSDQELSMVARHASRALRSSPA